MSQAAMDIYAAIGMATAVVLIPIGTVCQLSNIPTERETSFPHLARAAFTAVGQGIVLGAIWPVAPFLVWNWPIDNGDDTA